MSLKQLDIPALLNTSSNNLIRDFFAPTLAASTKYDRGAGYFSSGWLRVSANGMATFAENGGRARWVTSPILAEEDWEALKMGESARTDEVVYKALRRNLESLVDTLEQETLSALSWMIADSVIDFRLAVPQDKLEHGNFHDKFGIFTDADGNSVSFNGSYNDSIQGLRNYESIKTFCSWNPGFVGYVDADRERFERLWNNQDPNVRVFDLPSAIREDILQLRIGKRPYSVPSFPTSERIALSGSVQPHLPERLQLRDYQTDAIQAWFDNKGVGIMEMATGTGKTITSLAASVRLFEREKRLAVIFTVPYQHLVDQWEDEAKPFGFSPILAYQSKSRWLNPLNTQIVEFNSRARASLSVITTHTTFSSPDFQSAIARLDGPTLVIADEVHHLGAERSRQSYPSEVSFRLGLSATPDRWFDDMGTLALRDYFGDTVYSFPLEKAIGVSLTPYYYHPHLVPLTDEEMEQYERLTAKIVRVMSREDEESQNILQILLTQRAELLNNAGNKLPTLSNMVDQETNVEHTLFYCAPAQVDPAIRLLGWEKGLLVHKFTAEENTRERKRLLTDFACNRLQGLVAMKCLDEGVDVPSTRTAYILASSSNPREFIQRRGRVLRKSPGKEFATIHDLIAVPPSDWSGEHDKATLSAERGIIRKELQRFKEFAGPALNKHQALDVVWNIAKRYGLMDF